jgi:DNA modification methylase
MLHIGDCREWARGLAPNSIQCLVTSPPYFALRSYLPSDHPDKARELGGEKTPDEFVANLVALFRDLRAALHPTGTCWVVLGDSYMPDGNQGLIPHRFALAMQSDGWILRSTVVWGKLAPMPESVQNRPTSAHEYIFIFAKSRGYFFDAIAIAEPAAKGAAGSTFTQGKTGVNGLGRVSQLPREERATRNSRSVWMLPTSPYLGVVAYGTYRIPSPDCPAHDYLADLGGALRCDERPGASPSAHSPHSDDRPEQSPGCAETSTLAGPSAFPADATSANGHSTSTHKTAAWSEQDGTGDDTPVSRTGYTALLDHSTATSCHIPASSSAPDASLDGMETGLSAGTHGHNVRIATFDTPPPNCTCKYRGKVEKKQDHFAVFPSEIPRRAIRAGTSEKGACAACGAPWRRVVEHTPSTEARKNHAGNFASKNGASRIGGFYDATSTTTGWSPTCNCGTTETCPCVVADPFAGSGTTLAVAVEENRAWVGCDLDSRAAGWLAGRLARVQRRLPLAV